MIRAWMVNNKADLPWASFHYHAAAVVFMSITMTAAVIVAVAVVHLRG
jgi:hypothetical protein